MGSTPIHIAPAAACSLQSCPTLCGPMDCSPPGSSVHGSLQARILTCVAIPSSRGLPNPGMELGLPHLQADALPLSHLGSSQHTLPVIISWDSIFQSTLFPNKLAGIRLRKIKKEQLEKDTFGKASYKYQPTSLIPICQRIWFETIGVILQVEDEGCGNLPDL